MARKQRECYLCGKSYQYCGGCSSDRMKPAWMSEFHDENCKKIFDICTRFNMNLMSKSEAQVAINACDLSNRANFKSYAQRDLENIFKADEEPKKRGKRAEIKVFDEVVNTEPIIIEPVVDPLIEESHEVVTETIENE